MLMKPVSSYEQGNMQLLMKRSIVEEKRRVFELKMQGHKLSSGHVSNDGIRKINTESPDKYLKRTTLTISASNLLFSIIEYAN